MKFKFILLTVIFVLCSSIIFAQNGNASDNSNGHGSTISSIANMYTNQSDNTNGSSSTINSIGSIISDEAKSKNHSQSNNSDDKNGSKTMPYTSIPGVNGTLGKGVAKLDSLLNKFENIFTKN